MNSIKPQAKSAKEHPYFPLMALIHATSVLIDTSIVVIVVSSALFSSEIDDSKTVIFIALVLSLLPLFVLVPSVKLLVEKIKVPRIALAISVNCFRLAGLILMAVAASNASSENLVIFPMVFVMLILSKSYSVIKTSTIPQVTNIESFTYYSSRLSMTTILVATISGMFFFAVNKIFSQSASLYLSSFVVIFAIVVSLFSYSKLGKRVANKEIDADIDGNPDVALGLVDEEKIELSHRNTARALKALFTYISSIRLLVGLAIVELFLEFKDESIMLISCFLIWAISSMIIYGFDKAIRKSKISSFMVYVCAFGVFVAILFFIFSDARIYVLLLCALLGVISAYSKVVYESRISQLVPQNLNTLLFSRGEVIMQIALVSGAILGIIAFERIYIGVITVLVVVLSTWAYRSNVIVTAKTNEKF